MPRGSARELLILSLPAIAVVIGLLWLKRSRRRRDTHTDPGGTTDSTPNSENSLRELIQSDKEVCNTCDFQSVEEELKVTEVTVEAELTQPSETEEEIVNKVDLTAELPFTASKELNNTNVSDLEEGEIVSDEEREETSIKEPSKLEEVEIVSEEEKSDNLEQSDSGYTEAKSLEEGELEPSSSDVSLSEDKASKEDMKKVQQGELAQKLASLELDSMKIHDGKQKESSERDSANHSPSEVMLASPSISNFSDAHSEGSSDSGKGHSDVATSPSRTPAGGSSLAGDLANLSLYEFVLPQVIVGRLIGRHGAFLHEIRTTTQTNIFIKRHPDTNKLKICAIEGTQQDIDKALARIRQKFPLRRFPQLTLEKVPFVTINSYPPLKMEDFHLQLVEGVNNDVILSSLISAAHFFLQQPSHPTYGALSALNLAMNQVYATEESPILDPPVKDAVCVAPTSTGYYRAQIIDVHEESAMTTVRFLDYGGYLMVPSSCLRQIRGDLLSLPFQAVECCLANVAPKDEEGWSEEAKMFVQSLTLGQILQAQIYDYAEDYTPLVYLYTSNGHEVVLVNEELVHRGYGVLTSAPEE